MNVFQLRIGASLITLPTFYHVYIRASGWFIGLLEWSCVCACICIIPVYFFAILVLVSGWHPPETVATVPSYLQNLPHFWLHLLGGPDV